MSLIPEYHCELVDARTAKPLRIVKLPLVPRVGEVVRLDGKESRVARLEYELEGRQRIRVGHLSRIVVYLEPEQPGTSAAD